MPLIQEGAEVVRTKARLRERLEDLGHLITAEADPHLTADGQRIDAIELGAMRFAFALPSGRAEIELKSRTFIPAHTVAESRDTRSLGICVKRLQIDREDISLDDEAQFGAG